ncbi:hypothetical protein [Parerythrobacter aestuarii]|uniref:hypothetical protein n=1 Tax=Parerythrobacter aestuarii TaxID=3020909 RepID=UPI0024DEA49E|nr:hypothetical protein [Parerythrobacter aestuarii]
MNWATAIVLIVLISAVAGVLRSRGGGSRRLRQHGADKQAALEQSQREKELQEEVGQLKDRIQVLERIATDPARRTAEEIEKLRDER